MSGARCQSKHPTKHIQCGLPFGHCGQHQNGTQVGKWDDGQMAFLGGAGFVVESVVPLTPEEREMPYGE